MNTLIAYPYYKIGMRGKYFNQRHIYHDSRRVAHHYHHRSTKPRPAGLPQHGINKRITVPNRESIVKRVAIPGVEKILTTSHCRIKALWVLAVAAFYGLCVYQLSDRINVYFSYPVTLQQSVLNYRSVEFPGLTVCPADSLLLLQRLCSRLTKGAPLNCVFSNYNATLDDIWKRFVVDLSSIKLYVSCTKAREADKCEEWATVQRSFLATYYGNCITYILEHNVTYRGAETYFRVVMDNAPSTGQVMFVFHPKHIIPVHESMRRHKLVYPGYTVDVRFHYKQINFLNTRKNPCLTGKAFVECNNQCINKYFEEKVPCRLPFMINSSRPNCRSYIDSSNAIAAVYNAYMEYSGCNCARSCTETLIDYSFDSFRNANRDYTILTLRFPDNIIEVVTETYTYALSGLLSDVGGSLGFCVGLCLFSFVEVIEFVFRKLGKTLARGHKPLHTEPIRLHQ